MRHLGTKVFIAIAVLILTVAVVLRIAGFRQEYKLYLNGFAVRADVAMTSEEKRQGLSGRESLEADEGLLFLFPEPDTYSFWMMGMKFPIDIIWIRDGRVVDIAPNVQPPESPDVKTADLVNYTPRMPADTVLEVAAGTAQAVGLKIGDEVKGL